MTECNSARAYARAGVAVALGLWAASRALPAQEQANVERADRHCRIVFHPGDLAADLAGRIADQAHEVATAFTPTLQSMPGTVAAQRVVHLYRDEKEFRAVEVASSPYRFAGEAFTAKTAESHVLLWPTLPPELLAVALLSQWTQNHMLRVLAEQAVPKVAAADDWLRWVLVMGAVEAATNPDRKPHVDSRYDYRRGVVVSRRSQSIDMSLQLLIDPRYAFREPWEIEWAETCGAMLAQLLASKDPKWAAKLVAAFRRPAGREPTLARRRAAVLAILGENWTQAEKRYEQMCDGVDPSWNAIFPGWTITPRRSLLVGTAKQAARITATCDRMPGSYAFVARAELGPGRASPLYCYFGHGGDSMVAAWFEVGRAGISVWSYAESKFQPKAQAELPIALGMPFDFRVEVDSREVRVLVNGEAACVWAHGGREVRTQPFVEVFDRIVWLEGFRFEPLPETK